MKRLPVTGFARIRCIRFAMKDFQSVAVIDITNEGGDWQLRVHSVRPRPGVEVWYEFAEMDCHFEMQSALMESAGQCVGLSGEEKRLKHLLTFIKWLKQGGWE